MIDTEALRKKIIDLAIQGKLTPQLPEDGNAEYLYAQIQEEKAKLIREGKIKREKPLPGISDDEIPFEIPKNWKWVQLNDIGSWSAGATPSRKNKEYYSNGTIPWIKTGELNDGYIYDVEECITDKAFEESSVRLNPIGSVLIAMYGATIGKVGILGINATTNQACCACIPILIDNRFLFYFLKGNKDQFINSSHGGAQPNISKEIIVQSRFPLPPLAEQKRIVEILNDVLAQIDIIDALQQQYEFDREILKGKIIDSGIRGMLTEQLPEDGNAEDLYAQIQEQKAKLIKEGKIKKEKPLPEISDDEIPFEIPSNWKWVRLGDISSFSGGYAYKSGLYVDNSNNQVVRLGNVKQNSLLLDARPVFISDALANDTEGYRICEDDILVTMTGTRRRKDYFYAALIAKSDIKEKKLYLNQRVGCVHAIKGILPSYLVRVLQNTDIRNGIFNYETGAVNQGNLGSEDIKKYVYIPLPPLKEQKRIVSLVEELLAMVA